MLLDRLLSVNENIAVLISIEWMILASRSAVKRAKGKGR